FLGSIILFLISIITLFSSVLSGCWNIKEVQDTYYVAALNQLYKDAQQRLFWGHVSTLILSNKLLKQDIKTSIDFINRHREIRYNILLYATKESIEDVFKTKSFFTLSGLSTILHEPREGYKQRSYIQPIQFFQFIRDSDPVGQTAYIPSIKNIH
ncbi:Ger(x)C family spore germination protein, partial [Cytobacillus firmus]